VRVIAVSGSLRRGSYNTALATSAATLMPEGAVLAIRTVHGIPLYEQLRPFLHGFAEFCRAARR
jgi:NAD(P)H-dependent FMN reductase